MKCKDNRDDQESKPNAGIYPHPDKAAHDVKHGRSGLSQPNAGAHDRNKDPQNAARPSAGVVDFNKVKVKFDDVHKEHKA
jgi:hypothetical protein